MKTLAPLLLAPLFLTTGQAGAEGVYKWLDEQGRPHFAGTPPAGKKADKLNIPAAPAEPAAAGSKTWQEQLQLSNQRRQLARDKEQEAAKRQQDDERRCLAARRYVDTLNRQRPLYNVNDQGGRDYLDDGQRQAAREAAGQQVATYCRN